MSSKNQKIMILQVGDEPCLVRNQVTKLSSRYFWPLPWNDKSLSLMVLSTNLIRQFTSLACSPCRREFISLHTVCFAAWNVYRTRKSFVGVSLGLEKISIISLHGVVKISYTFAIFDAWLSKQENLLFWLHVCICFQILWSSLLSFQTCMHK